jgi:hypothetical protein
MKWILKHLNWVTVFGTIICWLCSWLIIKIVLRESGMAYIPYPGTPYYPPETHATDYPDFTRPLLIDIAIVMSLPVYILILKKKKRSYIYLLFLLSPLLMSLYSRAYNALTALFTGGLWLAGFIILLILENKSTDVQDTQDKT